MKVGRPTSRQLGSMLCAMLPLASCSLAPTFSPVVDSSVTLPEVSEGVAVRGESIANKAWWDIFQDQHLRTLIEHVLADNRSLAISAARIMEARALLGFVRADQFPFLDVAASAQRGDLGNVEGTTGPINDFSMLGELSFEVDLWGKLRNATEAQRRDLLSTEAAYRTVTIALVSETARLYFTLVDLDNRVMIAQRTIENRSNATRLIRARFEKGIIPQLDLNQAQIEEADAKISLAALERERRIVENALRSLQGRTGGEVLRRASLEGSLKTLDIPGDVPAALLSRRPDVQAAEEAVHSAYALIGVAEAQRLPSLSLTGSLGLRSDTDSGFFDADSRSWSAGGGLFGPLLNWNKNISRVEVQNARAEQALNNYEDRLISAAQEVSDALIAITTYQDELIARGMQREAAANAARLSRARYDDGIAPYIEVLDIERSLFSAELGESEAQQRYLSAIVQLYKALGGGWQVPDQVVRSTSP